MFGLLLKGITSIGAALCFSVGKAVYDVATGRRSPTRAILNVGLTSVFHGVADIALDALNPDLTLTLEDDHAIQVPFKTVAECTAENVIDIGVAAWLDSYDVETLPSGLALARTALVDCTGGTPRFQGIIVPEPGMVLDATGFTERRTRQIILNSRQLAPRKLPHQSLRGRVL